MKKNIVASHIAERNKQNKSVVVPQHIEIINQDVVEIDELLVCSHCRGTKFVKGLFSKSPCGNCSGLGIDLSNPLGVIAYFLAKEEAIKKAKEEREKPEDTRDFSEEGQVAMFYSKGRIRD